MKQIEPIPLFFLSGSVAIVVTCAVYHIAVRPEWTQAQTLRMQWLPISFAVIFSGLGIWLEFLRR